MGNLLCCCSVESEKRIEESNRRSGSRPSSIETKPVNQHTTYNTLTLNESNVVTSTTIVKEKARESPPAKDIPTTPVTPSLPPLHPTAETSRSVYSPVEKTPSDSGHAEMTPESSPYKTLADASGKKMVRRISSGLSSRGSFTTTKEHREFRVFLPVLTKNDNDWIDADQIAAYNHALEALKKEFGDSNTDDADENPTVEDTFIVGKGYFGLRYLEDKKLEMRVKTENTPNWMEKWSKVRFGKKAISHYKADIVSYLHDVGHKDPTIEKIIDEPHLLVFAKKLLNAADATVELGEISVSTTTSARRQRWLTVYYGGDSHKIEEFAFNHRAVWAAVEQSLAIGKQHIDRAHRESFSPVISGYPLWLRVVAAQYNTPEEWRDEVFPAVEEFLTFLKGDDEDQLEQEQEVVEEVRDVAVNLFQKKSQ